MRDRIKAKADRAGMSMNEAVVWCLEQYFPAPITLEQKIDDLVQMVAILKGDDDKAAGIDRLVDEIHDAIAEIEEKKIPAPTDFRRAVSERWERWQEEEAENQSDLHENRFDDSNWPEPSYRGPIEGPTPDDDSISNDLPKKD